MDKLKFETPDMVLSFGLSGVSHLLTGRLYFVSRPYTIIPIFSCRQKIHSILPLYLNISRRPSCTDPLYRTGLDHCAEDSFDGRGADIGENFANLGFG